MREAEVVVSKGQIIDIVITNPGSGYTEAPKVVTARRYDIVKQKGRKVDTFHTLGIASQIQQQSPVAATVTFEFLTGLESLSTFDASARDGGYDVNLIVKKQLTCLHFLQEIWKLYDLVLHQSDLLLHQ